MSADAEILAALLADYLRESYPDHLGSTPAQLRRDVLTEPTRHHVLVAEIRRQTIGFVDWDRVYDMHWASSGAGRALRHLAQFAGKPVREVMRNLPPTAWNVEA